MPPWRSEHNLRRFFYRLITRSFQTVFCHQRQAYLFRLHQRPPPSLFNRRRNGGNLKLLAGLPCIVLPTHQGASYFIGLSKVLHHFSRWSLAEKKRPFRLGHVQKEIPLIMIIIKKKRGNFHDNPVPTRTLFSHSADLLLMSESHRRTFDGSNY